MAYRIYETVEALQEKIDQYFDKCEKDSTFPDRANMLLFLGISEDTIERYERDGDKYPGYAEPIKNAKLRREGMLARGIFGGDSKEVTGMIFLSKQPSNGGYTDRPAMAIEAKELTIKIDGLGEGAFG